MNLIVWNCRGSHNPEFRHQFRSLLDNYRPVLAILLETHMQDHEGLRQAFEFTNMAQVSANGLVGGLGVLWNEALIGVEELRMSEQEIHCLIQVCPTKPKWLLSTIYASNSYQSHNLLWKSLMDFHDNFNYP